SEEHTSELQSLTNLVCRLLLEKKKSRDRLIKEFEPDILVGLTGAALPPVHAAPDEHRICRPHLDRHAARTRSSELGLGDARRPANISVPLCDHVHHIGVTMF